MKAKFGNSFYKWKVISPTNRIAQRICLINIKMTKTIQKGIPAFIPPHTLGFFDAQYFQIDVMNDVTVDVKNSFSLL